MSDCCGPPPQACGRGGHRLEFTTDGENAGARRFYARLGIPVCDKVFCRLEDEALDRFAAAASADLRSA